MATGELGSSKPLWLLNGLLARGAVRSLCRRTLSMPGLYLIGLILGLVTVFVFDRAHVVPMLTKLFFLFNPVVLTLLALFALRTGLTGTAFFFSGAETGFLLPAPIRHSQLVAYKFCQQSALTFFVAFVGRCLPFREFFGVLWIFCEAVPHPGFIAAGATGDYFIHQKRGFPPHHRAAPVTGFSDGGTVRFHGPCDVLSDLGQNPLLGSLGSGLSPRHDADGAARLLPLEPESRSGKTRDPWSSDLGRPVARGLFQPTAKT